MSHFFKIHKCHIILGTYYLARHSAGYRDEQDRGSVHEEETNKFPFSVHLGSPTSPAIASLWILGGSTGVFPRPDFSQNSWWS